MSRKCLNLLERARGRQDGVVLIVVLVMLGALLIIVAALIGTSNVNFRIVANQQHRMEGQHAAQNAIESYISNPANFILPLPTTDTFIGYDMNGDGDTDDPEDYLAVVPPPACLRAAPIAVVELDFDDPADQPCFGSSAQRNSGILGGSGGTASGNSWCSRMMWDVRADIDEDATGVQLAVHQGIYMRALIGTTCP